MIVEPIELDLAAMEPHFLVLLRSLLLVRLGAYAARTPFRIENNNVRLSALHYQDGAREAITSMRSAMR